LALSTVSNALSGKNYVGDATRLKVQDTAVRLGYRPSAVARALRMQRSFAIGVLANDIANPAFPAFVRGIEDVALRENSTLLLCNTDGLIDRQIAQMRTLHDRRVDGMVLISQFSGEPEIRELLGGGMPFVLLQRRSDIFDDDYVGADNAAGMTAAIQHLVDHGHRRIGFIRGPAESSTAMERLAVFRESVPAFGLDADPDLVFPGDYSTESGGAALRRFMALRRPPTAIMASNDLNALGVFDAAAEQGRSIPEDLSVIGFDDIPIASLARIALTTVHLPKRDMGAAAAELLMTRIKGEAPAVRRVIAPTRLVIRNSTGPASAGRNGGRPRQRKPNEREAT
jgi:LacI family transcriptional regulator